MQVYGKILSNGKFKKAPLNYRKSTGETVLGFCFNVELMTSEGYKPVQVDEKPAVGEGQRLVPSYSDEGDYIRQGWTIVTTENK